MPFLKRLRKSQLIRGSLLIFLANNTANFGNFLYNLAMGRLLTPRDYANLGAILSLLVLISVPFTILQLSVVKLITSIQAAEDKNAITLFFRSWTKKVLILGFGIFLIVIFSGGPLSRFLHISGTFPFMVMALFLLVDFPVILNKGVLHGLLAFTYISLNSFLETGVRFIVSVVFVLGNWGVAGALMGYLLGGIVQYISGIIEIRGIFRGLKRRRVDMKSPAVSTRKTVIPVLFVSLILALFFNSDVILVRHFFPDTEAGNYVALSTIGRIIYYAAGPVISVMFPLISGKAHRGEAYIFSLLGTLVMTLFISLCLNFLFFLFPQPVFDILYGGKFTQAASYLNLFSIFMTIYTLNSVLTYFLLSISLYFPLKVLFPISLLPGVLIFIKHDNIFTVIWINIAVSLLYFFTASWFVWKKEGKVLTQILMKGISGNLYANERSPA